MIELTGSAALDGAGGYAVSGRWAFNTDVRHAQFSQVAAVMLDKNGRWIADDRHV